MTSRRVALLGNMNNNHFAFARYLRDRGLAAQVLLYDQEQEHFHPACDSYDLGFREFTRSLAWGSVARYSSTSSGQIRRDLDSFDVVIGNGLAPAYCAKAGRPLDIFVPFGDDIWALTKFRLANPAWLRRSWPAVAAQRRGIGRCRVFHMAPTNELYEGQWRRLGGKSERWHEGFPAVYHPMYKPAKLAQMQDRTHWAAEFSRIREAADIMLFSSVRHVWRVARSDPNAKGTDRLLRGIALFRKEHPQCRVVLATMEYGKDVEATKMLAQDLGIEDCVAWLPRMYRKDLMIGLAMADIACGEFENSWIASGVLYEAMAIGRPILAHRDDSIYASTAPVLYPILNAKEPEEIADALSAYYREPGRFKGVGEAAQQWYENEVVGKCMSKYLAYIANA